MKKIDLLIENSSCLMNYQSDRNLLDRGFRNGWDALLEEIESLPVFENFWEMESEGWMLHDIVIKIIRDIKAIQDEEIEEPPYIQARRNDLFHT